MPSVYPGNGKVSFGAPKDYNIIGKVYPKTPWGAQSIQVHSQRLPELRKTPEAPRGSRDTLAGSRRNSCFPDGIAIQDHHLVQLFVIHTQAETTALVFKDKKNWSTGRRLAWADLSTL